MCGIMDHNEKEDLTTSSFQQKIFDWFNQRGMLSELRSHLRHQMITAFQNSSLGNPNPTGRFTVETPIPPALQALLLLVAEFLAQQEYHYTVSILVAEVPLLATFPKFSAHVSHLSDNQLTLPNRDLPRYSKKDVMEILETLGIERNCEACRHILRLYMDSAPQESLLACVLTALPAVAQDHASSPGIEPENQPENLTYYIEEIRLFLLRAQLDKSQLNQLEDILRRFHARAAAKAREEERAVCLREAETNNQQLRIWENAARERQREAEVELESSKRQLNAVTAQLRVQHDDILKRLHRVQKHAEEVRIKEARVESARYENEKFRKQLEARNEQLLVQQTRLEEGFRSLQEEREKASIMKSEIQNSTEREKAYLSSINDQKEIVANMKAELEKTRLELHEVRLQLKANAQGKISAIESRRGAVKDVVSRYTQTEFEEPNSSSNSIVEPVPSSSSVSEVGPPQAQYTTRKAKDRETGNTLNLVRHLRQENSELKERNVQLQRRLEEVTEQAAVWASSPSRLVDSVVPPRAPAPPPPPPPPPPSQLRKTARSCELGAGEELGHPPVRQPSSSRDHTLHLHGREWKRTAPKQLLMHVEPSDYPSSDESVSEEVLRETGRRLRHLDAESKLIDRRRKELKESALTGTASYMFIPTASTSTLTPPPAVRPYEPGSNVARTSLFPEKLSSSLNFGLRDSIPRYSQVTWPDVPGTSTPLRSPKTPFRRITRGRLSLSRDRQDTTEPVRNGEERIPTSTENDAFSRLDAALDNIKLIREDLKDNTAPEKLKTKPNEETEKLIEAKLDPVNEGTIFRHCDALDSPSRIRDKVMASLRASTAILNNVFAQTVSPVKNPQRENHSVVATPRISSSTLPKLPLAPIIREAQTEALAPVVTEAQIEALAPVVTEAQIEPVAHVVTEVQIEPLSRIIHEVQTEMSAPVVPENVVSKLPLAPEVQDEPLGPAVHEMQKGKSEDSPKDSTLNEIPTPASSPSMVIFESERSKRNLNDGSGKSRGSNENKAEEPVKTQPTGSLGRSSGGEPLTPNDIYRQPAPRQFEVFQKDSVSFQPFDLKEDERVEENSSPSNRSKISAGSNENPSEDSFW